MLLGERVEVPMRAVPAKSVFISAFLAYEAVVTVFAAVALVRGGGLEWVGVLATSVPLLALVAVAYATRRIARTSAGVPWLTATAVAGFLATVLITLGSNAFVPVVLAGGALVGTALYVSWYSYLDRPVAPLLAAGKMLPTFEAIDEQGVPFRSDSLIGRPAVLLFYRGNWCPFCVAQVGELAAAYSELERRGAQVVLVSPQPTTHTRALARRLGVPMKFVVDEDARAARRLGIAQEGGLPAGLQASGYDSDTVLPTAIVTDAEGRILFVDATDNYRVRPEPATFLAVLDAADRNRVMPAASRGLKD